MAELDMAKARATMEEFYGNEPHPNASSVKVKDYPTFARLAMMIKGDFPDGGDVAHIHELIKGMGISPSQYEHAWKMARPIANRLLGRDPTPEELRQLAEAHPGEYHNYYSSTPHPNYPEVTAGDMARYHHAAKPISQKLIKRDPVAEEVARFASAGYTTDDIHRHYKDDFGA